MRKLIFRSIFLALACLWAFAAPLKASDAGNLVDRAEAEMAKGHDMKARFLARQAMEKEPDNKRAKAVLEALAEGDDEEAAGEPEAKLVPSSPELEKAGKEAAQLIEERIKQAEEAAAAAVQEPEEEGPGVLDRAGAYLGNLFSVGNGLNDDQSKLLRRLLALLVLVGGIALEAMHWSKLQRAASLGMDLQGYWGLPLAGRFPFVRLSSKIASVMARFWLHLVVPVGLVLWPAALLLWAPTLALGLKLLVLGLLGGALACVLLALSHGVWGDLLMLVMSLEERGRKAPQD